jgi:DNA ligase (NAD+)
MLLSSHKNRDALKASIEAHSGKLTGSVSSKTTALITNFPDSGTTKIKKAQELGIEIITEEEFIRRYLSE